MPVPDFQTLFLYVLRSLSDGSEHPVPEIREAIATQLHLTSEELAQRVPGGSQTTFVNRIAWATVYLAKAAAIDRIKRGVFQITPRGREILNQDLQRLTIKDLAKYPEFIAFREGSVEGADPEPAARAMNGTPEARLDEAYKEIVDVLASELLDMIKKGSPQFFEQLVVDLLGKIYGSSASSAEILGKPGDGGIDGVINQDKLGLERIHLQAKRWDSPVGRPDIQTFAGSLDGARSRKGVFITTSRFSPEAKAYVNSIDKRIVLIDGRKLVELMIEHEVGVRDGKSYVVKSIDSDYFEQT